MWRWLKRLFRRPPPQWPRLSSSEVRKRSRILVIDDAEFPYLPLLEADGYRVDKWEDVHDLSSLEDGDYDALLLDIHGVGSTRSSDEGLGILRHIKRVAPAQAVIAYSGADFSLKYKDFFDLADAALPKDADYVDFKKALDEVLEKRFSLDYYLERIVALAPKNTVDVQRLREAAAEAILQRNPQRLKDYLLRTDVEPQTADRVLQVAQIGISVLQVALALA